LPRVEWSLRLLYQSTQPAVAYSTSAMVLNGPGWKTVVRTHSALNRPLIVSIRALSYASPTVPIEGLISYRARCSVSLTDVYCDPASEWQISCPGAGR